MMRPVLLIIGTRPEGIKLIPLYFALKNYGIPAKLCATFQHTTLLSSVFSLFDIVPDISLTIMKEDQSLAHIMSTTLTEIKKVINNVEPSLIIVQGDTTTAYAAALAAWYEKIPIGHVEAGLRTYQADNPFPEEINRRMIALIASYHFAPTERAAHNLKNEGVNPKTIFVTGNTIVDALHSIQHMIIKRTVTVLPSLVKRINDIIQRHHLYALLTMHRRETHGPALDHVFVALHTSLDQHPTLEILYPTHPNPRVQEAIERSGLRNHPRIHVLDPLAYHDLIYAMTMSSFVITDSGGIQEEATSLNKRLIVVRKYTERTESIDAGLAILTGTNQKLIAQTIHHYLITPHDAQHHHSIYGDGKAANKITDLLAHHHFALSTPHLYTQENSL